MAISNAINLNGTGLVTADGDGTFTYSTPTPNGVLYGGAANDVSSLAVASTGTVMIGNTGAAPSFSATPSVTSITVGGGSALTTYVSETAWTPTLNIGGSSVGVTYTENVGKYYRIGNTVHIYCRIILSSKGGLTGDVLIGGLPINCGTGADKYPICIGAFQQITFSSAAYNTMSAVPNVGTAFMNLYKSGTGVTVAAINVGSDTITDTFLVEFTGHYYVGS